MVSACPTQWYVSYCTAIFNRRGCCTRHRQETFCLAFRNDLISVMLSAPFHTTKAVLPSMIEKGLLLNLTFRQGYLWVAM